MKAKHADAVKKFTDIPNIGPAMVKDFELLGIKTPLQLKNKNGYSLHRKLCKITGFIHDPCVIDTFLAAIDFMNGAPAKPWWKYTEQRKKFLKS